MPIYEYLCHACGNKLETIQKINEPVLTKCPVCHKNDLQKLISTVAFRLKGNGWYETDFKSGNKRNLAAADEKTTAGSANGAPAAVDKTTPKKKESATGVSRKSHSSEAGSSSTKNGSAAHD